MGVANLTTDTFSQLTAAVSQTPLNGRAVIGVPHTSSSHQDATCPMRCLQLTNDRIDMQQTMQTGRTQMDDLLPNASVKFIENIKLAPGFMSYENL